MLWCENGYQFVDLKGEKGGLEPHPRKITSAYSFPENSGTDPHREAIGPEGLIASRGRSYGPV